MRRRRIGRAVWRFDEGRDTGVLGGIAEGFDGWLRGGERVKENPVRLVVRRDLAPFGPVFAKRYRYRSWRDRLRYLVVPTKAEAEWRAMRRFRAMGLPTAEPLAVAVERMGPIAVGGALVTRAIAGARPAAEALADPAQEEAVLRGVAGLARRLARAGVWHRDLHLGNFLVSEGSDGPGVHLLDLHTCIFLPFRLPWVLQARALARLLHSVTAPRGLGPASEAGKGIRPAVAIVTAYFGDADPALRRLPGLLARALRLEERRLRSRSRRAVKRSSRFRVERADGWRVFRRAGYPLEGILAIARRGRAGEAVLKARPGRRIWRDRLGDVPVCAKEVRYAPLGGVLRGGGALRRAWRAAEAFAVRGIPVPEAIALVEEMGWLGVRRAVLITRWLEGAAPLVDHLRARLTAGGSAAARFAIARALAAIVRRLHAFGIYHRDLAPQNWLCVDPPAADPPAPRLYLVDLESVHRFRRLTRRRRWKNLVDLGNIPEGHVTWTDRARFLRAYGGRRLLRDRRAVHRLRRGLARAFLRIALRLTREEVLADRSEAPEA